MGRRVRAAIGRLWPRADDSPADDQHGADRHLAPTLGGGGLAQTLAHQLDVAAPAAAPLTLPRAGVPATTDARPASGCAPD